MVSFVESLHPFIPQMDTTIMFVVIQRKGWMSLII